MRLINEDDVLGIIERVTNEAVEKRQPKYLIQPRIICEIAGLPTIEAQPNKEWISVKDRLPEEYDSVLLVAEVRNSFIFSKTDRVITIGRLKPSGKWQTIGVEYLDMEVTHWRTLPALPKGE